MTLGRRIEEYQPKLISWCQQHSEMQHSLILCSSSSFRGMNVRQKCGQWWIGSSRAWFSAKLQDTDYPRNGWRSRDLLWLLSGHLTDSWAWGVSQPTCWTAIWQKNIGEPPVYGFHLTVVRGKLRQPIANNITRVLSPILSSINQNGSPLLRRYCTEYITEPKKWLRVLSY